jgi:hypothetical protein
LAESDIPEGYTQCESDAACAEMGAGYKCLSQKYACGPASTCVARVCRKEVPADSSAPPMRAENPGQVAFGCAPWDGPTLDIRIGMPDQMMNISIWAKGYDDLLGGARTVVINNKGISPGDSSGTGRATLHGTQIPASPEALPYQEIDVTVHFEKLEMKEGGAASGYVERMDTGAKFPFESAIAARMPCG